MTAGQRVRHVVTGLEGDVVQMRNREEVNLLYAGFSSRIPRSNVLIRTSEVGSIWYPEHELEPIRESTGI